MRWSFGHEGEEHAASPRGCMPGATLCSEFGPGSSKFLLRPLILGVMGLAIAVILWGLAYKLSLYRSHQNHHASVNVAKLWVGPRERFFALNNNRTKLIVQCSSCTHPVTVTAFSLPALNSTLGIAGVSLPIQSGFASLPSRLRSPPEIL
jgi:hypothetical protein